VAAGPVTRLTHERFAHSALAREAWIGTRGQTAAVPARKRITVEVSLPFPEHIEFIHPVRAGEVNAELDLQIALS
jgi:hypothetical protein